MSPSLRLLLLLCCLLIPPAFADEARERAVLLARAGAFEPAIAALEALLAADPADRGARADLLAVLEWSGRPDRALEVAGSLVPAVLPDYALLAWARALRAAGRAQEAAAMLSTALAQPGRGTDPAVLHALLLSDLDRLDEALDRLAALRRAQPRDAEAAAAEAYVMRRLGMPGDALRSANAALAVRPDHAEAARQQILALVDLGAADRAQSLAQAQPGLLAPADADHVALAQAAQRIRLAYLAPESSPDRTARVAEALTMLQAIEAGTPADSATARRARFDRIAALRARGDMPAVLSAYERLLDEGIFIPAYVRQAAADAALAARQPERAEALYRTVLAEEPALFGAELGLVYALVEAERHAEAMALADAMVEARPAWRRSEDGARAAANWERLSLDLTAAMLRAYANQPAEAQRRLEALRADAPASAQIRRPLATVYRWRGWPHRAWEEAQLAQAYEPEVVQSQLEYALALEALERFGEAAAAFSAVQAEHALRSDVARELRRWRDRQRWRLSAEAGYADSDGFVDFGSRARRLSTRVSAPVIADHWQPYAFQHWTAAGFPEGERAWRRAGVGFAWRDRRRQAYLEVGASLSGATEAGVTAGFDWHLGDHWSFATRVETFSLDAPLRARELGLEAWKAEAAVRWAAHESLDARLGVSRLELSDGNVRTALLLSSGHRLRADARHVTTGSAELYGSHASRTGGLYFNPSRDTALGYTVSHDWLTWRRYDRAFTQRFVAGAGTYWQADFGSAMTGVMRYEHLWSLSRSWRLRYGAGLASRVYDGNRETQFDALIVVEGLF